VLLQLRLAGVLPLAGMADGVEVEVEADGVKLGKMTAALEKQICPGQLAVMTKVKEQQILRRGVPLLLRLAGVLSLTGMADGVEVGAEADGVEAEVDGVEVKADGELHLPVIHHRQGRTQMTRRIADGELRLPMISHLRRRAQTTTGIRLTRQKVAGPYPAAYKLHQPGAQEHYSTTMLKTNKLGATQVLLLT
jgi:hypothetical protein